MDGDMHYRGVLSLTGVAVFLVAGCGTVPPSPGQSATALPSPTARPSAGTPPFDLQGTWELRTSPDPTFAPSWDLLVTQKGNGLRLANLDRSSYGDIVFDGMAFDAVLAAGYEVHGFLSADGRDMLGSAPSAGILSWSLAKVSDDFIRVVRTRAFPASGVLRIPVGRSFVGKGSVDVTINGKPVDPALTPDGLGGYWTSIPLSSLTGTSQIAVQYTRQAEPVQLFAQGSADTGLFLRQSAYLNWGYPTILAKSRELTTGKSSRIDKARAIQQFVISRVAYSTYSGDFSDPASRTLALGYGMCINSSRLFVALARAAGIPARSVWGVLNEGSTYDSGHEWAEFLDDSGYWHPLDFTATGAFDLSNVRFLGLVYDPEENFAFNSGVNGPYAFGGDVVIYSSFPMPGGDQYGFQLIENDRDKKVVENVYVVEAENGQVRFVLELAITS